ncbi:ATP-binding cassette sub-family B member 6 [Tribolium castaneum]|uniref:ATP-binding cassette sub-family B member 6 n=1 Tax=Tribolium castaneum TaxID=7070 RepID=D2A5D4_TRICA|nr:PREDICTED: ATP-binding cassette sub-family B member 6, mitochondrial isoform X1 [Tribolium castaneum]EFA05094.1 Multidrug resistance protein homolog 65-like Protein [Tribolium castaneum]|eukprot:XP_008194672.1 PREDICTED: ATP-binding cassette sub-family B member 6, mitochondrial isoform X1 [Tribolium castaneum]
MAANMSYCPPGVHIWDVWVNHGTSQCFVETLSSSVIAGFILLAGTIQLCMYRKYGTEISPNHLVQSRLYHFQIFVTLLVPVLEVVRFVLRGTVFDDKHIYGFMITSLVLNLLAYPFSLLVVRVERHYLLPSVPTKGHGIVLLLFWTLVFISENLAFFNLDKKEWWFQLKTTEDQIEMGLFVVRYLSCLLIFLLGLKAPGITQNINYFTLNDSTRNLPPQQDRTENQSTWRNLWKKVRILAPFIWPKKDVLLQFRVIFCFLLLAGGRVINLYVPIYNKYIVDSMTPDEKLEKLEFRWDWILVYVAFKFLQGGGTGGMGLLNNLRSFLWIRIQQYTTREVEVELFRHLHSLSLRWHLGRKTGEVLRVMDRGTDSINNLLNYIIFSIFPTIVDIIVAVVFFVVTFNAWFGLIVFITMVLYIALTISITEWRTKFQRRMNLADNETRARSVDSLLNFETVKYYGAEQYEVEAFREAILRYQVEEWKSNITLNILNTVQNIIICTGLLAGSLLCAWMVVEKGELRVGDYVLFATYIVQLYVPLNWFGTYYRAIQKNFVDMENMFDLLKEDQEVIDAPNAGPIAVKRGAVEFNNVSFGYLPERLVLKNVTFSVPQGKTVALVGPSGSGKSTIIRLLFRFYDVETGSVIIDGQNIKTVTQESLRRAIGVVPQDTVLFNNTIRYNIKYGRLTATDADVIEAARGADIHDRILTFPDAYDTQVGERGLRLSGGEKQRVAIARTLLKAPMIILLDEATSALDTQTERNIQESLDRMCANRTTIIVAHRLSTVIHADEILVLRDGEIIERGKHEHLIGQEGVYASMWKQQLESKENSAETSLERS